MHSHLSGGVEYKYRVHNAFRLHLSGVRIRVHNKYVQSPIATPKMVSLVQYPSTQFE